MERGNGALGYIERERESQRRRGAEDAGSGERVDELGSAPALLG